MKINDIYPTIQGEGCQTGVPMVIVRLQGCSVGCPWCDTKETWEAKPGQRVTILDHALGTGPRWAAVAAAAVASRARELGPAILWALVTGGEPAEQPLDELVEALHRFGFRVAVETSGTALGHVGAGFDWVCVSPKFNMPGGLAVLPAAVHCADEIKQVVGKMSDIHVLETFLADLILKPNVTISLQPVSQNVKATQLCVEACMRRGWRLSLQQHKSLNVR